MKLFISLILLVLFALPAWGATYWIGNTATGNGSGSDVNNLCGGTADTDCISAGVRPLSGDTAYVCGAIELQGLNTPHDGGTPGTPVVVDGSCPGGTPATWTRKDQTAIITIDQADWTFQNITFGGVQDGTDNTQVFNIIAGGNRASILNNIFAGDGDDYFAILININNGSTDIVSPTIQGNTFRNITQEAIRAVPRNSTSACTASPLGKITNPTIADNLFADVRMAMRTQALCTTGCSSCITGRPTGLRFTGNTVNGTTQPAVNIDWQSGGSRENTIADNVLRDIGVNTPQITLTNAIQTGYMQGGFIEENEIYTVDNSGSGDSNGIIVDRAGTDNNYLSDGVTVRRNYIEHADGNSEACGIMVYAATNTVVESNIVRASTNGICIARSTTTGTMLRNNTLSDLTADGIEISVTAAASTITNNAISGAANCIAVEVGSTAPTETYNVLHGCTDPDNGFTKNGTDIETAPQFIGGTNPTTAEGFRLIPTSPNVGTGSPNGAKYDYDKKRCGNPSNIGAFCTTYQDTRASYTIRTDY